MKKLLILAVGFSLSVLSVATVNGGAKDGSETKLQKIEPGKHGDKPASGNAALSKRNRARIEVEEMKKIKQKAQSEGMK